MKIQTAPLLAPDPLARENPSNLVVGAGIVTLVGLSGAAYWYMTREKEGEPSSSPGAKAAAAAKTTAKKVASAPKKAAETVQKRVKKKAAEEDAPPKTVASGSMYGTGMKVSAFYKKSAKWYNGVISDRDTVGKQYKITWDSDGTYTWLPASLVKPRSSWLSWSDAYGAGTEGITDIISAGIRKKEWREFLGKMKKAKYRKKMLAKEKKLKAAQKKYKKTKKGKFTRPDLEFLAQMKKWRKVSKAVQAKKARGASRTETDAFEDVVPPPTEEEIEFEGWDEDDDETGLMGLPKNMQLPLAVGAVVVVALLLRR